MSEETKETLTEEEAKKLAEMDWGEREKYRPNRDELEKLKNTVEELEADFKSSKGLIRFMIPGILINDRLILVADPDEYRANIALRAMGTQEGQIRVNLTIAEAERLARLLPQTVEASRKRRLFNRLKIVYNAKKDRYRRRY